MEQQIEREFGFSDWNRGEEHQGEPLRAILKDFIRWKTPFHCKKFADLRKNLKTLNHKQLILNMDINEDNYVGGRLVDFSIAMTNPHILFQPGLRTKRRNRLDVGFDLACFDEMVEEYEARKEEDRSHNEWAVRLRRRTK